MFALSLLVTSACGEAASTSLLESELTGLVDDLPGPIHYFATPVDLDGDREPEWIVHLVGPSVCGTGGCDTMVFKESENELELVTRITLTRPPIVVANTETEGWRDLTVRVSGGGLLPGHSAKLPYDGTTYAANPTVPPAEPLVGDTAGETVVPAFRSFKDGDALRE